VLIGIKHPACGGGYRLRQGRRNQIFFTKHFHKVKMFCEEDKKRTMLPQAILPFTG
jgi:hypothetical protein